MDSYSQTSTVGTITYEIGQPSLTSSTYQFDELPVCNYPETVTATGLPSFMIFDEPSARFQVPQTSDLSLIGVYSFVLRSEIQVPNRHPDTATFTTQFVEETVNVIINPCEVSSYTASPAITEISYRIGEPELTDGSYAFV